MDELLLTSHLRRAASGSGDGLLRVGPAPSLRPQPILQEKPKTAHIVLPDEARFRHLIHKSRYALDIGGTLIKLVYTTVFKSGENGSIPEVLLNFTKYLSIEECLTFIKQQWTHRSPDDVIHCTGGGSFKHAETLQKALGVRVKRTDEMHSLIFGCDFLLQNNEDESFTYHHEAIGIERYQYKPVARESIYPFLLVNIGTGISVLKVDSPTTFERVGGSSMGGGSFIGLGSLLTEAQSFDQLLLMADSGDHRKCDTLVSDIYGGGYDNLNLPGDLIAGSFGKCNRLDPRKPCQESPKGEDIARSLLLMISNNIGQMAMLYGHRYQMKRIYFGGFFIRKHPITMRTLTYAINFWSKGEVAALFMKHEGYLGAVGAFLDEEDSAP